MQPRWAKEHSQLPVYYSVQYKAWTGLWHATASLGVIAHLKQRWQSRPDRRVGLTCS